MTDSNLSQDFNNQTYLNSIKNITLGFMMTVMTLNFLYLQYILPTIGAILLYMGFRNFKEENKALYTTYIFSIINLIINSGNLIFITTPLYLKAQPLILKTIILTIFQLSFLIIFREGFKNLFNKHNIKQNKDPILMLIIWNIVLLICATTILGQVWYIPCILIIFYFYIFYSLYKLKNKLETINYIPTDNNLKLSNKQLFISYIGICLFIVSICCVISNHIKIDSTEFIPVTSSETRDILISQGFPEDILADMADEDISLLENPLYIESFSETLDYIYTDEKNLKSTTIFIELSDNKMYAIEFLDWQEGTSYWNDGFTISSSEDIELINGILLYEKEGIKYTSSIPRLNDAVVNTSDILGHIESSRKITGAINFPFGSTNQKCYVVYKFNIDNGNTYGINIVNYFHNFTPFKIPYVITEHQNLIFQNSLRQHATNFTIQNNIEITD